jgi:hypothetical protein
MNLKSHGIDCQAYLGNGSKNILLSGIVEVTTIFALKSITLTHVGNEDFFNADLNTRFLRSFATINSRKFPKKPQEIWMLFDRATIRTIQTSENHIRVAYVRSASFTGPEFYRAGI